MIIIISGNLLMFSQASKADDDDFQEFQEAPKSGVDQTFTEFQGESAGSFPTTIAPLHQNRYCGFLSSKLIHSSHA